jgi:hypothetical protein
MVSNLFLNIRMLYLNLPYLLLIKKYCLLELIDLIYKAYHFGKNLLFGLSQQRALASDVLE